MNSCIIGASGLIGFELLNQLALSNHFSKIIAITRTPIEVHHLNSEAISKINNITLPDFENLDTLDITDKIDVFFCCLGTTIKKSKTKEAFLKVDKAYVLKFADLAAKIKCPKFIFVSSLGADKQSPFFYNQTKGIVENCLSDYSFSSLIILRPSLLIGNRKEFRIAEKLTENIFNLGLKFLFIGPYSKYKPIPAKKVAEYMLQISILPTSGKLIIESDQIFNLNLPNS